MKRLAAVHLAYLLLAQDDVFVCKRACVVEREEDPHAVVRIERRLDNSQKIKLYQRRVNIRIDGEALCLVAVRLRLGRVLVCARYIEYDVSKRLRVGVVDQRLFLADRKRKRTVVYALVKVVCHLYAGNLLIAVIYELYCEAGAVGRAFALRDLDLYL